MTETSRIETNIVQMLLDRKYIRIDKASTFYPAIFKSTKDDETIYVYWEKESIDKKRIIANVQQMRKAKVSKAIIVSKYTISDRARRLFHTLGRDPLPESMKKKNGIVNDDITNQTLCCIFELFDEIEFHVNIIKHCMIPQHIALTAEEKAAYLDNAKILESQLPGISPSDAICRHYGWKKGLLIKITRDFEGQESVYYRLVN